MGDDLYVKQLNEDTVIRKVFKVESWNGSTHFDIREWNNGNPTRKGVTLPALRWVSLTYAT